MSIHPKLPNAKYQARDLTLIGRVILQHCCWFSTILNNIVEPAVGCHNAVKMNVIPTTLLHPVFNNSIRHHTVLVVLYTIASAVLSWATILAINFSIDSKQQNN